MSNPWAMKMEQFTRFTGEERRRLDALIARNRQTHGAREDVIAEGAHAAHCHVLLSGFACR